MNLREIFKIAFDSIAANKVRAVLTMLGIIIGISAVIALLSLGQGAQSSILEEVQGLGTNTITVVPVQNFGGFPGGRSTLQALSRRKLDNNVLSVVENQVIFPEINIISPQINSNYEVSYKSKTENFSVDGVTEEYFSLRNMNLSSGRLITSNDDNKRYKGAVLGHQVARKLFGESDPLENNVKINGVSFQVVGVISEKDTETDGTVFIPLNSAAAYLAGSEDFSRLVIQVKDDNQIDNVAGKLESELLDYFRESDIDNAQFSIFTSKDIISLTSTITGVFTTLLSSIAGISLLVGGIGIMNIMLVSVTERTKEIGLRKAVGARQNIILLQFIAEAVILTVIGGLIGITLGLLLAFLIGAAGGIPVILSLESIGLATGVSAAIGLIFGFYPAWRAAKLNPIDALRYE